MPNFFIRDPGKVEADVKKAVLAKMRRVFRRAPFLLDQQAEILQQTFENSNEFQGLFGSERGKFGFTDQELTQLPRILKLLVPGGGNQITVKRVKTQGQSLQLILDWVDFEKLKTHEFAQHVLTRLDQSGRVVGITDVVSWVEWLEEGEVFRGFQFFRPSSRTGSQGGANPVAFSRSGEGLMRPSQGSFFRFEPTRVFQRIAKLENGKFFRRGFGVLVQREAGR